MSRIDNTKVNIILDGNSIPYSYSSALNTELDTLYGSGNYIYTNVSVGGQTTEDMITRMPIYIKNNIGGFSEKNLLVFQEIRNQLWVAGSTTTVAYEKVKQYIQDLRALLPSYCVLKVCVITATADNDTGANIDIVNNLIRNDVSGEFDFVIDLYNHSTFDDYTSGLFNVDETHLSASGITSAASFISTELHAQYPL